MNRKKERTKIMLLFLTGLFICFISLLYFFLFQNSAGITSTVLLSLLYLISSKHWMILKKRGVPILTFHSITDDSSWLPWPYLCVSVNNFESYLLILKKKGYTTVSLSDVKSHMEGRKKLEKNVICLTFDDGYLDNWVYAYPLLKQFGFSGTIFVATDFINYSEKRRYNLIDVQNEKIKYDQLKYKGYLSPDELLFMEEEKIFQIESHTMTHTWLYKDDTVETFIDDKNSALVWKYWNLYPELKGTWFEGFHRTKKLLLGHPHFAFSRAHLVEKAFFPNTAIDKRMNRFLQNNEGQANAEEKTFNPRIRDYYVKISKNNSGHLENEREAELRIKMELLGSKNILENILHKNVKYLCWPGDMYTERLKDLALGKYKYECFTGGQGRNTLGEEPVFSRLYVKHQYSPFKSKMLNNLLFYSEIKLFEGNLYYLLICMIFYQINKFFLIKYKRILDGI